jgi:NAD+ synthase
MAKEIRNSFRLALAQADPVVGDIDGNAGKVRAARAAAAAGADLIAFTELFLTGYPIEDLVLKLAL